MKFLDVDTLSRIAGFLQHVDCGDYVVSGNLEAYSCKLAGFDKKLSQSLDKEVEEASSPFELSKSPVGPLAEQSSRKTLIYLILTLNHIYPDYDFTLLRATHFRKEAGLNRAEEAADNHLLEVARVWEATPGLGDVAFLESVWSSVDDAVTLKDCDVYSYNNTDGAGDPFGEHGGVWSFNFFFYNKKIKRIVYFSCRGFNKSAIEESGHSDSGARFNSDDDDEGGEYGMPAGEMDL